MQVIRLRNLCPIVLLVLAACAADVDTSTESGVPAPADKTSPTSVNDGPSQGGGSEGAGSVNSSAQADEFAAALQGLPINGNLSSLDLDYDQTLQLAEELVEGTIVDVSDIAVRPYNARTIRCGEREESVDVPAGANANEQDPDPDAKCEIASQLAVVNIEVEVGGSGDTVDIELPVGFMTGAAGFDEGVLKAAAELKSAVPVGSRIVALTTSRNQLGSLATHGSLALVDSDDDTLHYVPTSDDLPDQGLYEANSLSRLESDFAAVDRG